MERWKINLYAVWSSQILTLMSFSFGIPFLPFYVQDLGIVEPDRIKIYAGLLSTAPAVTMGIMAPIWGIAADRWGKKLMLLRAIIFASVLMAAMGFVTTADQLVVLRFIQGLFTGTVTAAAALVATSTPSHRLSYSLGFLSTSTFIGSSIGPIMGGYFAELVGHRNSFFIGAVLLFINFFLTLFFIKEEKVVPEPALEKKEPSAPLLSIFSSAMVIMLAILFIMRLSRSIFGPYLPLFVQEMLSDMGGAARVTGIINGITGLMTALAGFTLSRLGDRYSKGFLLKVFFASSILAAVPLFFANNLWLFTAAYAIFFFVAGGIEPIVVSLTTESTPKERRGALFGIQAFVTSFGWAVSPMLGSLISIKYSIKAILLLIPLTLLPGLVMTLIVNRKSLSNGSTENTSAPL